MIHWYKQAVLFSVGLVKYANTWTSKRVETWLFLKKICCTANKVKEQEKGLVKAMTCHINSLVNARTTNNSSILYHIIYRCAFCMLLSNFLYYHSYCYVCSVLGIVLFCVLFVCNVYRTTATGCQSINPVAVNKYISYHIISYHIISYHIISYTISYHNIA